MMPEDFGALYLQWAAAIHRVDPNLKLGGPSFQEILPDSEERANKLGNSEWMHRFLDYLKRRGRLSDYSFFSFEWYPFDDVCAPVAPQLARAPKILEDSLREFQKREIQIKDLDRGLIDFPAILGGKEVFLCWEQDEEDIEFWHDLNSGYAGRERL